MGKTHDDIVRVETIAALDAVESAVVVYTKIFLEVARGEPLDPQRAENLTAQCAALRKSIIEIRNTIQLSADSRGVH